MAGTVLVALRPSIGCRKHRFALHATAPNAAAPGWKAEGHNRPPSMLGRSELRCASVPFPAPLDKAALVAAHASTIEFATCVSPPPTHVSPRLPVPRKRAICRWLAARREYVAECWYWGHREAL